MVRLRVEKILAEQGKSKYWLCKNLGMSNRNFNNIINGKTSSIHFETLDRMSQLLNTPVGDLFEQTSEDYNNS